MIDTEDLLRRRLLAALDQAVRVELPADWDRLKAPAGADRAAAGALLRLAAEPGDRAALAARLRRLAAEATERRKRRESPQEGKKKEEKSEEEELWAGLAHLVGTLDRCAEDGAPGLLGLALWSPLTADVLTAIRGSLRGFVADEPEADEELLGEAARILLRARARRWIEADLGRERPRASEEGR